MPMVRASSRASGADKRVFQTLQVRAFSSTHCNRRTAQINSHRSALVSLHILEPAN